MLEPATCADPIEALNERARAQGWTFTCDHHLKFEAPKLNAISALWKSHALPGKLPARADFSARDLKDCLSDMAITDIVKVGEQNRFRYRYVGTNLVRTIGEMTGRFMDEVLPASVFDRTVACYEAVVETCLPLRVVTRFSLDKINFLSAELFGAPLAHDGVTLDMVISVTHFRWPKP